MGGYYYEAAEEAGIDRLLLRFPAKTHLQIEDGEVRLESGSDANWRRI